ncbi:MAG: hypothetical protein K0R41_3556 [Geminicoccaceae bacterium]|nr:hypothetical protein [Geminicoccaceae bacterium]MCE3249731.1 hypothetical protein [Geminicoccaceae bacterium]MDF2781075.1 hypothetical protein [Geminicoccaceae bacterium]
MRSLDSSVDHRVAPAGIERVACAIGEIPLIRALKDVAFILVPMLGVLLLVIRLPD